MRHPCRMFPLLATLGLALAGCGEKTVSKAEVEKTAMKQLSEVVGQESPPITCPGDLKAEVGATLTCAMDINGATHDVNVVVTAVDGGKVNYDVEVAEQPRSGGGAQPGKSPGAM